MRRILYLTLLFPLLLSCGSSKGKIRFDVELKNIDQADILVYSPTGAFPDMDTLHLLKGKCEKEIKVTPGNHTYTLLYPNMQALTLTANEGTTLKLRGNAQQLADVQVKGAENIVSVPGKSQPKATFLPQAGEPLPKDSLIQATMQKGKSLLVAFWANWRGGSGAAAYALRKAMKEHPDSLTVLTYSLDVDYELYRMAHSSEDTLWAAHCDFRGWDSPTVKNLRLTNIPYFILVDSTGLLKAHGADFERDIRQHLP